MRFGDFLKATVLLSAGTATLLAALTVIGLSRDDDRTLLVFSAVWWIGAVLVGDLARPPRRGLTADRAAAGLRARPDDAAGAAAGHDDRQPAVAAAALRGRFSAMLGVFLPPVAAVAAGCAIIWALAWRRQERAVLAIEQRDGARFYVDRTSPFQPIRLIRTPGFGGAFLRQPL